LEWTYPLRGGDFNIVKNQREKSNGLINFSIVDMFNDSIDIWVLMDIKDPTRGFTWTNNQKVPIMTTLDRILMTTHWGGGAKYPFAKIYVLPKGVSDHNPVMITFGERVGGDPIFRFEKWWFEVEGFENLVKESWNKNCSLLDPMGRWQFKMRNLRKRIKGWSRNIDAERKKSKEKIMDELDGLDRMAEFHQLTAQEFERKKILRGVMDQFWKIEEIKARQRSRKRDIKEGGKNIAYFVAKANKRKRKKCINSLEEDGVKYEDNEGMIKHAT
jgi:hypothetical protein